MIRFLSNIVILVLLSIKCNCKITININAASNIGAASVNFSGADNKLITEKEIGVFNITDDNLKRGLKMDLGRAPDYVILKDSPNEAFYEKYKWDQVHRKVHVEHAEVLDIINENVELIDRDYVNNTTNTIYKKLELYKYVENTMKSYWSKDGLPNDDIFYSINVSFNIEHFSFENKWRRDNFRIIPLKFGVTCGTISIQPGKAVTVKLFAKKTIILTEVTYTASLTGNVIANYPRRYETHYFWAPPLIDIMKILKLNNDIITTEYIEIKCYIDPVFEVRDKETGKKVPLILDVPFRGQKYKKE